MVIYRIQAILKNKHILDVFSVFSGLIISKRFTPMLYLTHQLRKEMNLMKTLDNIALALTIVGGLNWLTVGLFEFDFVAFILGGRTMLLAKIVYVLVGLSALYCLKFFGNINRRNVNR